jgi:twinkle protein
MLRPDAQTMIEGFDDETFCTTILGLMDAPKGQGPELLWEEWVLARLNQIRHRDARVFYGYFLTPLKTKYPRRVFPPDILAAMAQVTSQPDIETGDVTPETILEEIEASFTHGPGLLLSPGWERLTSYYTIRPGEMTIVTGTSNAMKSLFLHAMTLNVAERYGWNFSVFTPEHHPLGNLGQWMTEAHVNQPMHAMEKEQRLAAMEWLADHFHFIRPAGEAQPTVAWLLAVARMQKERYGIEGLVLDPWNEIEHCYEGERETQYISAMLSQIRRFARAHNVHVWIVAHTRKLETATKGKYAGHVPPPTPFDISGSAAWWAKADNCLSIWRDLTDDSQLVEVHIQKIRNRNVGHIGQIDLRFSRYRFHELGDMTQAHWTERD